MKSGSVPPTDPPTAQDEARVTQHVVAVAVALNAQFGEITEAMRALLISEIKELNEDQRLIELLSASIEGNLETVLHILEHNISAEQFEPPTAALEYARRMAQHDVPLNALVRGYRLGQNLVLERSCAEILRQGEDAPIGVLASQRIVSVTFAYIDWISRRVVNAYEVERERWLENRNTIRAIRVRELIAGRELDLNTAEAAIGYSLRQNHLGVVVWMPDTDPAGNEVVHLAQVVGVLGRELSCTGRPLFIPCDRSSAWGWMPLGRSQPTVNGIATAKLLQSSRPGLMLALGGPAHGIGGFRDTHRQAVQAQRVALVAGQDASAVTAFTDPGVRAAALMCADLEQTRLLVRTALGRLAIDDAHHARLRETLLTFLSNANNYTATAELLSMHKNSVKYRIAKAEEERGSAIGADRLDVELALVAGRLLGRVVLEPPDLT
jgi:DNA-binding PucR family transcriptional regulator